MTFNKLISTSLASALLSTVLACTPIANAPAPNSSDSSQSTAEMPMEKMFTVTLESPTDGGGPLAPGVFVIHRDGMPLFTANSMDMGKGLEALAEDGNPVNLSKATGSMVFNTPVGDSEPAPQHLENHISLVLKQNPETASLLRSCTSNQMICFMLPWTKA